MANVIYKKGQSSNLDKVVIKDGQILVTEDTGEMYIDMSDGTRKKISDRDKIKIFTGTKISTLNSTDILTEFVEIGKGDELENAKVGDMYLNTDENRFYGCVNAQKMDDYWTTDWKGINYDELSVDISGKMDGFGEVEHSNDNTTKIILTQPTTITDNLTANLTLGGFKAELATGGIARIYGSSGVILEADENRGIEIQGNANRIIGLGDVLEEATDDISEEEIPTQAVNKAYVDNLLANREDLGEKQDKFAEVNIENGDTQLLFPDGGNNNVELRGATNFIISSHKIVLGDIDENGGLGTGIIIQPNRVQFYDDLHLAGTTLTGVAAPTDDDDAVNKAYVDEKIANITITAGEGTGQPTTEGGEIFNLYEDTEIDLGTIGGINIGKQTAPKNQAGEYAHAEGVSTAATGRGSHAEGAMTKAEAEGSHTEGAGTWAAGAGSHAEGRGINFTVNVTAISDDVVTVKSNNSSLLERVSELEAIDKNAVIWYETDSGKHNGEFYYATNVEIEKSFGVTSSCKITLDRTPSFTTTGVNLTIIMGAALSYMSHIEGNYSVAADITATNLYDNEGSSKQRQHAEGSRTLALGYAAHSEGELTVAEGNMSHAQGKNTTAKGGSSFAGGDSTLASGYSSTALGYGTTASGQNSEAKGYSTEASGNQSVAEGHGTKASGTNTHAEGYQTQAVADASHSEGENTIAEGSASHAEGAGSKTDKHGAHAEGIDTIASGEASHSEGKTTFAGGKYSHAEGLGKITLLADGELDEVNSTGTFGEYAHTEGWETTARGQASHAEGYRTKALGYVGHAEGSSTIAEGNYSHAEGNGTHAKAHYSHAEGNTTHAEGNYSHAEGNSTHALGTGTHAEGSSTTASNSYSHAEGASSKATEYASHAEGYGTEASGNSSHSEGSLTKATYKAAHAEGSGGTSKSYGAHAEGIGTIAGSDEKVSQQDDTSIAGVGAHAEGLWTQATGRGSHAGGISTKATAEAQTAIGKYNALNSSALFVIGNGTNDNNRENVFEVYRDGSLGLKGLTGILKFTPEMIDKLYYEILNV